MPPKIKFGVNLNFAKFVYGPKKAMEVVQTEFGLSSVEAVADMDFGPVFYWTDPDAYRKYHQVIYQHAEKLGVKILGVSTLHRDTGAIAHPSSKIRESAYRVGLALLEMAACYQAHYTSSALFTIHRELAEDPEQFQSLFDTSLAIWKRWLHDAHRLGIPSMLIETAAAYREGCSTIRDVRRTLEILDAYHWEYTESTASVGICYNTGHGMSEEESSDPRDRDFEAWFEAFPHRIHQIHLKDTDPTFQEVWHFGSEQGIIDLDKLIHCIHEKLTVDNVLLLLECPGKHGREIGEKKTIEDHKNSIQLIRTALEKNGYQKDKKGTWVPKY